METTEKRELLIAKLINGKVTYDKYGGQYFWINEPNGGSQMLAEMRGWGHIQNMFKDNQGNIDEDAAGKFQDAVGDFIADAINEKIERHYTLPDEGEKADEDVEQLAKDFAIRIQTKEGTVSRLNAQSWFTAGYKAKQSNLNIPNEEKKACTHPTEAIAHWKGEVFCVRCKQVITEQSNPNQQ